MTVKVQKRNVEREVVVYKCDRCGVEAIELEAAGWMCCALLKAGYDPMSGRPALVSNEPGNIQVACPGCTQVLLAAMNEKTPAVPFDSTTSTAVPVS